MKNEYIEELIEDYRFGLEYPQYLPDAYCNYNYWMAAKPRTELNHLGLDYDERIKQLDEKLLQGLKKHGPPAYMEKDKNHPLEYWWWHLDKIAKKEYPPELLPDHLKEIYRTF